MKTHFELVPECGCYSHETIDGTKRQFSDNVLLSSSKEIPRMLNFFHEIKKKNTFARKLNNYFLEMLTFLLLFFTFKEQRFLQAILMIARCLKDSF